MRHVCVKCNLHCTSTHRKPIQPSYTHTLTYAHTALHSSVHTAPLCAFYLMHTVLLPVLHSLAIPASQRPISIIRLLNLAFFLLFTTMTQHTTGTMATITRMATPTPPPTAETTMGRRSLVTGATEFFTAMKFRDPTLKVSDVPTTT